MAVRLRDVANSESEPATHETSWSDVIRPSERLVGGRITDKVGTRMGLRLTTKRPLSEESALALFDALQASSSRESCSR